MGSREFFVRSSPSTGLALVGYPNIDEVRSARIHHIGIAHITDKVRGIALGVSVLIAIAAIQLIIKATAALCGKAVDFDDD